MKLDELNEYKHETNENIFSAIYYLDSIEKVEVYGNLNEYNELVFVIKIFDQNLQGKGLGTQAFTNLIDYFGEDKIDVICASWNQDREFSYFEDGMSTNLKIFNEKVKEISPEDAALCTPTGKWAAKYGFTEVQIVSNLKTEVNVKFKKRH